MRYNPKDPHYANNDRFILSKGHAAPLLYAAWAETGLFPASELLKLREFNNDLEGHPTPRLAFRRCRDRFVGQGLSVGAGMALCARLDNLDYRTYVLLGDGECAEGSVWEAASLAGIYKLNNLVALIDVNRLGQSQATAFGHDMSVYEKRFEAFGWRTEVIDGHDMEEILEVLAAAGLGSQPLAILAKTYKGAGVSFLADKKAGMAKLYQRKKPPVPSLNCNPKPNPESACQSLRPLNSLSRRMKPRQLPAVELQERRYGRDA